MPATRDAAHDRGHYHVAPRTRAQRHLQKLAHERTRPAGDTRAVPAAQAQRSARPGDRLPGLGQRRLNYGEEATHVATHAQELPQ